MTESGLLPRCVVFGGDGFIGSHICELLLQRGHPVVAFDRSRHFTALAHLQDPRLERVSGDFLDQKEVAEVLQPGDRVFHLVSTTIPAVSNANMVFDVETNVLATIRLLEACVEAGVERVLYASSGGTVYGNPERPRALETDPARPMVSYGITKLTNEHYCRLFRQQFGLRTLALRCSNPYGPRHQTRAQGVIPVFLRLIRDDTPLQIWGDGSVVRDYVYVRDLAEAFLLAAEYQGDLTTFNLGSGEGASLRELIDLMRDVTGREPQVEYKPGRPFDIPRIVLDIGRAERELGWRPRTGLREGMELTWQAIAAETVAK
jgi:UDP-glucose 4-epimerase